VDDLQELSRVESRAYQLDIHPVVLNDLLMAVARRLNHQFADKQVRLSIPGAEIENPSANLPPVLADADRITQVMVNLLSNALTYTPPGGEVIVSVARAGGNVQISVKDNGAGIPAKSLPHIFDRFFRVDKSRSRASGGGSGIGLTIARAFVEAHSGRIWAESPGIGQGAIFSFTLPIA
jgi:signal transduction histidine kinase